MQERKEQIRERVHWLRHFLGKRLWEEEVQQIGGLHGFFLRELRILVVVVQSIPRGQIPLRAAAMTVASLLALVPSIVLAFTLVLKAAMTRYLLRRAHKVHSPALRASAIDCRNDMMVAILAIVGVSLGNVSPTVDAVAALVIGGYIVFNAYSIGRENIDYLMGSTPSRALLAEIRDRAAQVPRVRDVDDVRAHYVGNFVHVELDVLIDGELTTHDSHAIAERARAEVESLEAIDRAFIHVEPTSPAPRD